MRAKLTYKYILLLSALSLCLPLVSKSIYYTKNKDEADKTVYITKYRHEADEAVTLSNYKNEADSTSIWQGGLVGLLLFASCVKSELHDTPYPDHGQVELITDWSKRGAGIAIPSSYTVAIDGKTLTMTEIVNDLPILNPGTYPCLVYNPADKISVAGNTATVAQSGGILHSDIGWFFSSATEIKAVADKKESHTAILTQQVRALNLTLTIKDGDPEMISSVSATLSGIASQLNMSTNQLSATASIAPQFTRTGDKLTARVRILGVMPTEKQILKLTITFANGDVDEIESDISDELDDFNTGKEDPLELGGSLNTPTAIGINTSLTDWEKVDRPIIVE